MTDRWFDATILACVSNPRPGASKGLFGRPHLKLLGDGGTALSMVCEDQCPTCGNHHPIWDIFPAHELPLHLNPGAKMNPPTRPMSFPLFSSCDRLSDSAWELLHYHQLNLLGCERSCFTKLRSGKRPGLSYLYESLQEEDEKSFNRSRCFTITKKYSARYVNHLHSYPRSAKFLKVHGLDGS